MIGVARAAAIAVLAALVGWFAVTPSNAVAEPSAPLLVYAYDGLAHTASANDATTERGPPATRDHSTVTGAADSWSSGAWARLARHTTRVTTAYDVTTGGAELAQATGTTREPVRAASGGSVVLDQGGVDANGGRFVAMGRNMADRVIPYAEKNGYGYYKGTPKWVPRNAIERFSPSALEKTNLWFNRRWIGSRAVGWCCLSC